MFKTPMMLMNEAGDGKDGGGGAGGAPDAAKELADLKAANEALKKENETLKTSKTKDDEGLDDKAKRERESKDRGANDQKALEAALQFTMGADGFLKNNAALLPKTINDIFDQANKENFDSGVAKANAIKAGVIKNFFEVQSNLELLTPGLKSQLEDYLKLTNTGRVEKASQIFDSIFEPALEMLRRTKRAEAIQKGHGSGKQDAYKDKLMQGSQKHYLGEKK